jgi:hypothetical protein
MGERLFIHVQAGPLPERALLSRYTRTGAYTDCFYTDVAAQVTHVQFVEAFYTSWVFKLERWVLSLSVRKPSTDEQALQLARGELDAFAAWEVEDRSEQQVLLTDFVHRTRSWLMCEASESRSTPGTRLYFGSAIIPSLDEKTGKLRLSGGFRALLGFHKVYSVVLLDAARRNLKRRMAHPPASSRK